MENKFGIQHFMVSATYIATKLGCSGAVKNWDNSGEIYLWRLNSMRTHWNKI